MTEIKSPLIYPGSKSSVVDQLVPLIPEFKEYREPFIGSASIFLAVKQKYPDKEYWINDLSYELYNFFKMCQEDIDSVIEQIIKWRNEYKDKYNGGKELFYNLKRNIKIYNEIELASAYYIINKTAFSGASLVAGFSQDHYNAFCEEDINDLSKLKDLFENVKITNLDYQKVIELPSKYESKDVFLMCDPPYAAATESGLYGKGGNKWRNLHKTYDHYRFAKIINSTNYRYLITYDDSPFVNSLFPNSQKKSWTFTHKMRDDRIGKELLISNFEINMLTTTQQDILDAWLK